MKGIYRILLIAVSILLASCNESRRGNDSNVNETRNEAAEEENADKFAGKTRKDAAFIYDVVASSYAEVKLAELANQKSRKPEVQHIAQKLLSDHTVLLNELKTIAQAKAVAIPVEESRSSGRTLDDLAGESEKNFDEEWCEEMMDLHEQDIKKFENRFEDTEDAELKAFINKTLPVLKAHHQDLKACIERLRNKNS